jgi:hypothetical protein
MEWSTFWSAVTAIVALVALMGAVWQVIVSRQSQREATASALYGNYLSLAVQYPRLASGSAADGSVDEFERYEWFVSVMLHAFEQILDLARSDSLWRKPSSSKLDITVSTWPAHGSMLVTTQPP